MDVERSGCGRVVSRDGWCEETGWEGRRRQEKQSN